MNVVIFFTYGISLKDWWINGSLEREVKLYKKLTIEKDIKFTFITFGDESDFDYDPNTKNIKIFPIYSKYKLHKNKILRFIYSFFIAFKLKTNIQKFDLIKTNQLMGSWMAIVLKVISRKPLIVRTGYNILIFSIKNKKGSFKVILYYLLTQLSLFFSDLFYVSSNMDKKFLNKFFLIKEEKLKVKRNWVEYRQNTKPYNKRFDNKILSVGRLEKQKNFSYLLRSMKDSDLELDIVGEGKLKSDLEILSNELNVNCKFINNLPNSELLKLMSNYKIFVMSSLFEGNSKVILESMSEGCVPVVSNIENNLEIINHEFNGIIYDFKKDNLQELIENLISNDTKLERMSNNSRKSISDNYSLKIYIENEYADYLNLINT